MGVGPQREGEFSMATWKNVVSGVVPTLSRRVLQGVPLAPSFAGFPLETGIIKLQVLAPRESSHTLSSMLRFARRCGLAIHNIFPCRIRHKISFGAFSMGNFHECLLSFREVILWHI